MYDVVIIGAGPAGMTSAIYLARAGKKVIIIEKETIGGQMASSPLIENYPGYNAISGSELANNMYEQLDDLGVDIELDTINKVIPGDVIKLVGEDNTYEAKAVIIATGSKYRLLGLLNEEELIGKGIHFCVSCDGAFYKNKDVAVIGGGNSALINAIALSDLCNKVYLVQNLDHLTGENILLDKVNTKKNIKVLLSSKVEEIIGDKELEKIIISNNDNKQELIIDGMFISIGLIPQSDFVKDILDINDYGYIKSDNCITNIDNIFVAGDCRDKMIRQITVATSDGTTCAIDALNYLNK